MLNLTMQEAERYKVISEVEGGYLRIKPARQRLAGGLAGGEAGEILGLSERQVYAYALIRVGLRHELGRKEQEE